MQHVTHWKGVDYICISPFCDEIQINHFHETLAKNDIQITH